MGFSGRFSGDFQEIFRTPTIFVILFLLLSRKIQKADFVGVLNNCAFIWNEQNLGHRAIHHML